MANQNWRGIRLGKRSFKDKHKAFVLLIYLSVFLKDAQDLATIGKGLLWWGGSEGV